MSKLDRPPSTVFLRSDLARTGAVRGVPSSAAVADGVSVIPPDSTADSTSCAEDGLDPISSWTGCASEESAAMGFVEKGAVKTRASDPEGSQASPEAVGDEENARRWEDEAAVGATEVRGVDAPSFGTGGRGGGGGGASAESKLEVCAAD